MTVRLLNRLVLAVLDRLARPVYPPRDWRDGAWREAR